MNLKALPLILIAALAISPLTMAESDMDALQKKASADFKKSSEELKLRNKAKFVEVHVNELFQGALRVAAKKLADTGEVMPFAYILKEDGHYGVMGLTKKEILEEPNINRQTNKLRSIMTELANNKAIMGFAVGLFTQVKQKDGSSKPNLLFELEHMEGISMLKLVPLVENKIKGSKEKEWAIIPAKIVTEQKPMAVFIAANSK